MFSVSTGDVEGPGDCGSQGFINEEADVAGNKVPEDITTVSGLSRGLPDLDYFTQMPNYQDFHSISI